MSANKLLLRWVPPFLPWALVIACWFAGPAVYDVWIKPTYAPFEYIEGFYILLGVIAGVYALTRSEVKHYPGLRIWLAIYCLAVFYFLGEDMNWGQGFFGWGTPEWFAEHNKENETNLHNINSWFNQKPRVMVQLWILVGGFIVPMFWDWPKRATAKLIPPILWPGKETAGMALFTSIIPLMEWICLAVPGWQFIAEFVRFSEIQEIFFGWFMMLYALDLVGRMKREQAAKPTVH